MPSLRHLVPLGVLVVTLSNLFHQKDVFNSWGSFWSLEELDFVQDNNNNMTSNADTASTTVVEHQSVERRRKRRNRILSSPIDSFFFERSPSQWLLDSSSSSSETTTSSSSSQPHIHHHHAIVIPYRARQYHLQEFLKYMNPYLATHFPNDTFSLWILEQDDSEPFNRAWLANVGLREILRHSPTTQCVILHDVDLIPSAKKVVPYTTCHVPLQLGSELQHYDWTFPYPTYTGGITSMSLSHWQLVNGLSNDYIGWGGEDDDLYHRLRMCGLLQQSKQPGYWHAPVPHRPPKGHGTFTTISEKKEHHTQAKSEGQISNARDLIREMYHNSDRWRYDGLNDVYYSVTGRSVTRPSTDGFEAIHHIQVIPQKSYPTTATNSTLDDAPLSIKENATTTKLLAPIQRIPVTPVLEFVPILGVTDLLTGMATKAGIVWGACHYLLPGDSLLEDDENKTVCPFGSGDFRYDAQWQATHTQFTTPWLLPHRQIVFNPLEGTQRFTVVRNPYERAIEWFLQKRRQFTDDQEKDVKASLNTFLQQHMAELSLQRDYVYSTANVNPKQGKKPKQYIHHVLRYEHLVDDLRELLSRYEYLEARLDVESLQKRWNNSTLQSSSLVRVEDLSDATMDALNQHFDLDFSRFGYSKQQHSGGNGTLLKVQHALLRPKKKIALAPLQLVDIPFSGGEFLTRAAARVGIVWGACHYDALDECPQDTSGAFGDIGVYQGCFHEGQTPWLIPNKNQQFVFKTPHTTTFAVVRHPYNRAIDFYRHFYDEQQQRGESTEAALAWLKYPQNWNGTVPPAQVATYLVGREDPKKLNMFLQNAIVNIHRPHKHTPVSLPKQTWYMYGKGVDRVIRYESLIPDMKKLLVEFNMTTLLPELNKATQRVPTGVRWLDVPDLDNVTIDMVNRHYGVTDFKRWYAKSQRTVHVSTDGFWNRSQYIHPALHSNTKYMSKVLLKLKKRG
ncbi:Beta-1,4-galactosyltransferase 3 [Seminavis robusta]|uniref:Beta-1,4-galactosyltransferase 3 n=1 Tax=Seminavis robusta TaxID=568900 RepID=A0A9N8E5A5_9STRA|nr:Beta-1,4-galactosyltransferase 3 [Seminavis robusta]|eukprot:Sro687_g187180.1 Beta-1,4-galactosyltransferase 3 (958) ;mRNA; r:2811-5684